MSSRGAVTLKSAEIFQQYLSYCMKMIWTFMSWESRMCIVQSAGFDGKLCPSCRTALIFKSECHHQFIHRLPRRLHSCKWNQVELLDSWISLSFVQDHFIWLALLNGVCWIWLYVFVSWPVPSTSFSALSKPVSSSSPRVSDPDILFTGYSLLCVTGVKASGNSRCSIGCLFLDVCLETSAIQN